MNIVFVILLAIINSCSTNFSNNHLQEIRISSHERNTAVLSKDFLTGKENPTHITNFVKLEDKL
jgi:hypothetical protein